MGLNLNVIEPLFETVCEQIMVNTFMDRRREMKKGFPVYIRVNCHHQRFLYTTGINFTMEEYNKALAVKSGSSAICKAKAQIGKAFNKVVAEVQALNDENNFSFENLKRALEVPERVHAKKTTLFEYWTQFGDSKNTHKTREQYANALKNFFRFLDCTVESEANPDNPSQKTLVVKGKKARMSPSLVDEALIREWDASMEAAGLSTSSRSIYLRALRAVMNSLGENNVISKTPKFAIKQGTRRKEDFIPVSDILKIRDYQGHGKKAADWWIILYLCNGSNLKDLAKLEWSDDYFFNKELTYVRGKIADRAQVIVHIPVVDELQKLLDKYASEPVRGERVFPQILLNATSEADMESRSHDFNRQIRKGMQGVCAKLGIRTVTASTARNSYITTLTWHGIQDAFIDAMVGHVDSKNVLRGYQGTISPKKRLKVNNLLFVDPEIDEDDE